MSSSLRFIRATAKNFLMIGNAPITFDFLDAKRTLYTGTNGVGKSTVLDVLAFGLFGKAHRDVNLPQLLNCVNESQLWVEVVCERDGHDIVIRRGMKPKVFEVLEDEVQVTAFADGDELQRYLESRWIRFDYRTFKQCILLGASSHVSFLRLPAAQRRAFVEDLLDLQLFSSMATLAKEKVDGCTQEVETIRRHIMLCDDRMEMLTHVVETDRARLTQQKDETETALAGLNAIYQEAIVARDRLAKECETLDALGTAWHAANFQKTTLHQTLDRLKKRQKFYTTTTTCDTCQQSINDTFKQTTLTEIAQQVTETQVTLSICETQLTTLRAQQGQADAVKKQATQSVQRVTALTVERRMLNDLMDSIDAQLAAPVPELKLDEVRQERETYAAQLEKALRELDIADRAASLLKDDGLKSMLMTQYLPLINVNLQRYLLALDFPVQFSFTETFEERIKTVGKEKFTYGSFSDGQKKRLDLALLWTWRAVAKSKQRASSNLLILDEICDSSLDHNGVDDVFKVLSTLEADTKVIMMTPKGDVLASRFDRVYEFSDHKGFTHMQSF